MKDYLCDSCHKTPTSILLPLYNIDNKLFVSHTSFALVSNLMLAMISQCILLFLTLCVIPSGVCIEKQQSATDLIGCYLWFFST